MHKFRVLNEATRARLTSLFFPSTNLTQRQGCSASKAQQATVGRRKAREMLKWATLSSCSRHARAPLSRSL